jgi:phosphatidylserine/phosphatidylglycerophosphate/cardiolipin synthase-like enzyme
MKVEAIDTSRPDKLVLEPADRRETVLNLLRSAQVRVNMSLFRCDDSRVLDEIVATSRRNVDVKVLVTPHARGWDKRLGGLVTLLKGSGVDVRQYAGNCPKYHAKYLVVDDTTAMVASLNLTRKCFDETCDFLLVSSQPDLISGLNALFDFDWNVPDTPLPQLNERLIVGPNHARTRIIQLMETARYRIRIIDHRVSDPQILLIIARKMLDGVRIQILGRGEVGKLTSHGKMILIDGRIAFFGSGPLSRVGLDSRREVAVVIDDPTMVGELSSYYDRMSESKGHRKDKQAEAAPRDDDDDD